MKHKTMKTVVIVLLCFILLAGCGVVPTPDVTPEATPVVTPTPTPIEPTPTPIPYGSVIEVTISNIEKISTGVIQTLYSKFSIKLVQWTNLMSAKPDIYIHPGGTGGDAVVLGSEEMYRDYARSPYRSIRITDYLDKMPNYTSLFYSRDILEEMLHRDREASGTYNLGTTGYVPQPSSLWLYNRKWFVVCFKPYRYNRHLRFHSKHNCTRFNRIDLIIPFYSCCLRENTDTFSVF